MIEGLVSLPDAIRAGYGSRTKLYRLMKDGSLPAVRNGHFIYFQQEDLDALYKPARPSEDDVFRKLAEQIAKAAPALSAEKKRELAQMLG